MKYSDSMTEQVDVVELKGGGMLDMCCRYS